MMNFHGFVAYLFAPWKWKAMLAWLVTVLIAYGLTGLVPRISEDTRRDIATVVSVAAGAAASVWFRWEETGEDDHGDE